MTKEWKTEIRSFLIGALIGAIGAMIGIPIGHPLICAGIATVANFAGYVEARLFVRHS